MSNKSVVNTRQVQGRRAVRYETFGELLVDAEKLAKVPTQTLGNWSVGQIYRHLAVSINSMIDGPPFTLPAPFQWLLRVFLKKRMLTRTLDPGFKLPQRAAAMIPAPTSIEEGLDLLRHAVRRINGTDERAPHGGFGRITKEEWDAFQLRHCEMHMSFIVPKTEE